MELQFFRQYFNREDRKRKLDLLARVTRKSKIQDILDDQAIVSLPSFQEGFIFSLYNSMKSINTSTQNAITI